LRDCIHPYLVKGEHHSQITRLLGPSAPTAQLEPRVMPVPGILRGSQSASEARAAIRVSLTSRPVATGNPSSHQHRGHRQYTADEQELLGIDLSSAPLPHLYRSFFEMLDTSLVRWMTTRTSV
jgi:hypothetical protein